MSTANEGDELLKCAAEDDVEKLELMINSGDFLNYCNKYGESAVWFAARNACLKSLTMLIAREGIDLNAQLKSGKVTPLWIAAANGHIDVIQMLLDGGANPKIPDSRGVTPLWTATSYGFHEIVKLLLDNGCDCNSPRNTGESCLFVACHSNFLQIVEILIEHGADQDLARDDGRTPLMAAAVGGYCAIVTFLIKNGAKVTTRCKDGHTALSLAAGSGHYAVVAQLLEAGADAKTSDSRAVCPLSVSCVYRRDSTALLLMDRVSAEQKLAAIKICRQLGRTELANRLDSCTERSKPADLSEICLAMSAAGFTAERVRLQTSAASAVEEIYRNYFHKDTIYIHGSFGDGWGCNLSSVDGSIGKGSDIDFTEIMAGQRYHLKDCCKCIGVTEEEKLQYKNGHINLKLHVVSRPAMTTEASHVTPSMDIAYAFQLCCYPALTINGEGRKHFPLKMVHEIEKATRSSATKWGPCHLIRAGTPNKEGTQLRVSTATLEQICLQLLTTMQGQFYTLLKFIFKNFLGVSSSEHHQSLGLKSYHAKSLLLFMLNETLEKDWSVENLRQLLVEALEMLGRFLQEPGEERRCMPHFFLPDAALYFKREHSTKAEIVEHLRYVIGNLDHCLCEFRRQLKPLRAKGYILLHPFSFFPFGFSLINEQESDNEYVNACIKIKQHIRHLTDRQQPIQPDFFDHVDRIPSFAETAKVCLKALAYLRINDEEAAKGLLFNSRKIAALHHLTVSEGLNESDTKQGIWSQLMSHDSIWRISCRISHGEAGCVRFELDGDAPSSSIICQACFPCSLPFHERRIYINFRLLWYLLRLRFCSDPCQVRAVANNLFEDVHRDVHSADFEELHAAALATEDVEQARILLGEMLQRYDKQHKKTDEVVASILKRGAIQAPQLGATPLEHVRETGACFMRLFP